MGLVGVVAADDVPFRPVKAQQLVRREALEVQGLAGIDQVRRAPRRHDLVPAAVPLAPEGGAPGSVQLLHGSVTPHQPGAECKRTFVVVTDLPQLVAHVPHGNCGVVRIPFGQRFRDGRSGPAVSGRRRAELVARAVPEGAAVRVHRKRCGVIVTQPGRRRCCGCGQAHPDATVVQQVQDAVQPAEVAGPFAGLQQRPAEHPHRGKVDARLLHQPDILRPAFGRPLLGVVVRAVDEPQSLRQGVQAALGGGGGRQVKVGHGIESLQSWAGGCVD